MDHHEFPRAPLGRQPVPGCRRHAISIGTLPDEVHVADHVLRILIADRGELVAIDEIGALEIARLVELLGLFE